MNWYETHTLQPKPPFFISSVDSGNLVASLWTLQQGCLDLLHRPLISKSVAKGLVDHLRVLAGLRAIPRRAVSDFESSIHRAGWLQAMLNFPENMLREEKGRTKPELASDIAWFRGQTESRVKAVREMVRAYMPWMLPEFADLRAAVLGTKSTYEVPLQRLPDLIAEFELHLDQTLEASKNGARSSADVFLQLLAEARKNTVDLIDELRRIGAKRTTSSRW